MLVSLYNARGVVDHFWREVLLYVHNQRYSSGMKLMVETDVTIHSSFTSLSTLASIIQQIHFAIRWRVIKEAQFNKAIRATILPGLTFVGGAHPVDMALFFIRKHDNPHKCFLLHGKANIREQSSGVITLWHLIFSFG